MHKSHAPKSFITPSLNGALEKTRTHKSNKAGMSVATDLAHVSPRAYNLKNYGDTNAMENFAGSAQKEKTQQQPEIDKVKTEARKKSTPAPTLEVINIEGCLSTTKAILM